MKPFIKRWNSYGREEKKDVIFNTLALGTVVALLWVLRYLLEG